MDRAGDESEYSTWHQQYHPLFRSLLQRFGYYDIFLIDFESRNLVYSVKKEMDFATNLLTGPYAKYGLAEVVTKVHDRPEHGVQVVDFKAYPPSYEAPAAFMATPIFNGPHIVGIIALQFPVDEINHVMTGNQNWKAEGLGRSGETYLVGPDFLMRSISRFLIEDPEGYIKVLRQVKTPSRKVKLIEQLNTSVLLQEIDTEASRSAMKGDTATKLVYDYRDKPVISSYAPLRIEGLNWAIITKKDAAEAYQPARDQQKRFIIISVILVVLVTFIAIVLANRFVQPLTSLIASAEKIQAGHEEVVEVTSGDEFGQLGRALNGIVNTLRHQNEVIDQKNHEHRMLLDNVLPQGPAERLKRGEEQVAERARHVTVLYASVLGFSDLSDQKEAGEAADFLNALWGRFNDVAEDHGVEPHQTMGERYLAVCGLAGVYLDHAKRVVSFAQELLEVLSQFNADHQVNLSLRVGIHSGPVVAAIVGSKRFKYDLWGETVNSALDLHAVAEPNTILVSHQVCEQLHELFPFQNHRALERTGKAPMEVWALHKQVSQV